MVQSSGAAREAHIASRAVPAEGKVICHRRNRHGYAASHGRIVFTSDVEDLERIAHAYFQSVRVLGVGEEKAADYGEAEGLSRFGACISRLRLITPPMRSPRFSTNASFFAAVLRFRRALHASMHAGIVTSMKAARKITVVVPEDLVRRAKQATGLGLAPTVRKGLELVAARQAYSELRKLRGKVKLAIDLDALREDRR